MANAMAVRLSQDIIIPSCGLRRSGAVVSKEEAGDSFQWLLDNSMGVPAQAGEPSDALEDEGDLGDDDEADVEADEASESSEDLEASTVADGEPGKAAAVLSEDDVSVIAAVKELLTQGKMQLKTIVSQSGLSEDVVAPLLTEANGFRKNQQGWYSNV